MLGGFFFLLGFGGKHKTTYDLSLRTSGSQPSPGSGIGSLTVKGGGVEAADMPWLSGRGRGSGGGGGDDAVVGVLMLLTSWLPPLGGGAGGVDL